MSFYPVVGAGEEDVDGAVVVNKENSFIVQPIGDMDERDFINHIQHLLFNPTGQGGPGPFPHTQWGATVKLPSNPQAFELRYQAGKTPNGPQDYNQAVPLGDSAGPRIPQDKSYTQMKYGPRADPSMMDPLDQPGDVGNIGGLPGKKFAIKNRGQP